MSSAALAPAGDLAADARLDELAADLSVAEQVRLLTGATAWRLHAHEAVGLRPVVMSDGPVGVRGTGETPGSTSLLFPSPSAVAATWDVRLAGRLGGLFAAEARRHGIDVVLAPQVNLQRTPVAGRHFECLSEDPLLTAAMAGALVAAMQDAGVAACAKHYVANDAETERTSVVSRVDERTLREVYLAPFEHLVREVGVWTVMAAYNGVDDGTASGPATEHRHLLQDVLKDEWGFDGVVVSDWLAARRTVESAVGGLDLIMPGPGGPWEDALVQAVARGDVRPAEIADKTRRLLRLAARVGALTYPGVEGEQPVGDHGTASVTDGPGDRTRTGVAGGADAPSQADRALLRDLAARATVVVRDVDARLPLAGHDVRRVALLGPNAVDAFVQGGGSAHVDPAAVVSPEAGLRAALPDAELVVLRGGYARRHLPTLDAARCTDTGTGGAGLRVTLLDADGTEVSSSVVPAWGGWLRDVEDRVTDVRLTADVTLEAGEHRLELGSVGRWTWEVDGRVVARGERTAGAEVILDSSINSPASEGVTLTLDVPRTVTVAATVQVVRAEGYGAQARAELRHRPPGEDVASEIAAAVAAAASADLVVVVVGTNDEVESEGWDRDGLALPGRQDELVERVLDVAPDAVVVVNAGAPVLLPWLERARTVLWSWFPGQECGDALADVLLGRTEPAGRLPWTLPARAEDVPVPHAVPRDGVLEYTEGVHVGYRGWERSGAEPAAPFGHGLGWTTWDYTSVVLDAVDDGGATLLVGVANTGPRRGTEVVQVYLEAPTADPARPVRWLAGFATVDVAPGERAEVAVRLPKRGFAVWDVDGSRWTVPAGRYRARVGRSVRDLRLELTLDPPASADGPAPGRSPTGPPRR